MRNQSVVSMSRDELEQLYSGCAQQLFTCALVITCSPVQAEDAVHEAFCRLLRRRVAPADLKAYVFRVVRNAAIDQIRRRASSLDSLPDAIFDASPPPSELAEEREFKQQIVELLQSMSADERETIVQHLYGELTFQEIATVRQRPLGTVTSWYRRGIEKLHREMEVTDGFV